MTGLADRTRGRGRDAGASFARLRVVAGAQRELVAVTVLLLGLGRLVDPSVAWVVALVLGAVVLLGTRSGFQAAEPDARATVPAEVGLVGGVLAAGLLLAGRFVPLDWTFVAWLAVAGAAVLGAVLAEGRAVALGANPGGRLPLLLAAVVAAFVGFTAVAGLVAGGLSIQPDRPPGELTGGVGGLTEVGLALVATADAAIAFVLSYPLGRLLPAPPRAAVVGAVSAAAVVALAVGLLRAIAVPLLAGPLVLTLVLALWDSVRASTAALRPDRRWLWQLGLLGILGLVVVGWNLALR